MDTNTQKQSPARQSPALAVDAWFGWPRILFGKCVTAWIAEPRVALVWRRSFPPYSIRAYAIEVQIFRKGWAFGVVWFSKPNIVHEPHREDGREHAKKA